MHINISIYLSIYNCHNDHNHDDHNCRDALLENRLANRLPLRSDCFQRLLDLPYRPYGFFQLQTIVIKTNDKSTLPSSQNPLRSSISSIMRTKPMKYTYLQIPTSHSSRSLIHALFKTQNQANEASTIPKFPKPNNHNTSCFIICSCALPRGASKIPQWSSSCLPRISQAFPIAS